MSAPFDARFGTCDRCAADDVVVSIGAATTCRWCKAGRDYTAAWDAEIARHLADRTEEANQLGIAGASAQHAPQRYLGFVAQA